MSTIGNVSQLNINDNLLTIKDAQLTATVDGLIDIIAQNNEAVGTRLNNLNDRSFDALIEIVNNDQSILNNIANGLYKVRYGTKVDPTDDEEALTVTETRILYSLTNQQIEYYDKHIRCRVKENNTWGNWTITDLTIGEENVIESISVNSTAQTITNKNVNITVPTKVSDLTNDSNFTSNTGTITGITMNGVNKGTSGVVNLGTVLTEHQDISGKVDKVTGMGLSSNDYTTAEKTKLAGINIGDLSNLTTAELNSIFATS